ncbi:DUF2851 family protein [Ekhidna sp.]|uniref:DUF2851 family protein n=1 Tax=Ekhidna sp. TaxID=2608089 RepID=UPI003CCBB27C
MDEHFLHYIWKYQKFTSGDLSLANGSGLTVFYPGNHNMDSGPDFEEARIKIDNIEWAGQVEIHLRSSDWYHHNHQNDSAYENVILHVVWEHDKEVKILKEPIPTLELKHIVDPHLTKKYKHYLQNNDEILCINQIQKVSPLTLRSMQDRVLIERLEEKANSILEKLKVNNNDWEETTYSTLAENFGFSTNKESFSRLTQILPFRILKKVLNSHDQTEALLFGQTGFLSTDRDEYQCSLRTEHAYLSKKYQLSEPMVKAQWKFGKMRPANFPTVRIAQFASMLSHNPKLFSTLIETTDIKQLKKQLLTPVSDYWQNHYDFGKDRNRPSKTIGNGSFVNILINTVAPLFAAYSKYSANQEYMDRAVELLESLPAESNRITKKWASTNIKINSAFESQAHIQLFKHYCQKRRCLHCNIGVEILNR